MQADGDAMVWWHTVYLQVVDLWDNNNDDEADDADTDDDDNEFTGTGSLNQFWANNN